MKQHIRYLSLTGLLTALVFILTAYFHIPSHTGYTHIGDAVIYLSACLLPVPYAIFVGCMGGLLADMLTGFVLWAPATVIIKALSVLFFSRKKKILSLGNSTALMPASLICIGGYYLYEALITGNYLAPTAGIPGYITQSVLSAVVFIVLGLILDRIHIRRIIP